MLFSIPLQSKFSVYNTGSCIQNNSKVECTDRLNCEFIKIVLNFDSKTKDFGFHQHHVLFLPPHREIGRRTDMLIIGKYRRMAL